METDDSIDEGIDALKFSATDLKKHEFFLRKYKRRVIPDDEIRIKSNEGIYDNDGLEDLSTRLIESKED